LLLLRASWCLGEVREKEGIPQLEEDNAVDKEVFNEYPMPGSGGDRSWHGSVGGVSGIATKESEEEKHRLDLEGTSSDRHCRLLGSVASTCTNPPADT
jgi:hypothetical protein